MNNITLPPAAWRCTNPTCDTLNLKCKAMYLLLQLSQWYCASLLFLGPKSCLVWWHLNQDQYGRSSPGLWPDRWKTCINKYRKEKVIDFEKIGAMRGSRDNIHYKFQFCLIKFYFIIKWKRIWKVDFEQNWVIPTSTECTRVK